MSDLTTTAQVLRDIAVGDRPLPAGYADGYAFVQDQTAYDAYLGEYDAVADVAMAYSFDQDDFLKLRSLSEIPSTLLFTTAWPQANAPAAAAFQATMLLVKVAGNRYALHGLQGHEKYVGETLIGRRSSTT